MNRAKELQEELVSVFTGRGASLLDSILPPLVFVVANTAFGGEIALWAALLASGGFAIMRLLRRDSLRYALAGFSGVVLAALVVRLSGSETGFYLPGLVSKGVTIIVCVISMIVKRPLVAWTSILTRRWPQGWYWHPRVLPAYQEVTLFWTAAFAIQLGLEYLFYQQEMLSSLGVARLLLGWPFTIVLLLITYLYGLWRLGKLHGPSVDEFKNGAEPPWEGQKRGF